MNLSSKMNKNFISSNIVLLRKAKRLKQYELAELLGLTRTVLTNYEKGNSTPDIEKLNNIAKFFDISLDSLVNKNLSIEEYFVKNNDNIGINTDHKNNQKNKGDLSPESNFVEKNKEDLTPHLTPHLTPQSDFVEKSKAVFEPTTEYLSGNKIEVRKVVVTVDHKDDEIIQFVGATAMAGYLTGFSDPEYVRQLPYISISGWLPPGTYRGFEVIGDSMDPTLKPGDKLIARYMDDWMRIRTNDCFVIVNEHDIVVKRIERIENGLKCISDNEYYPPYELTWSEIREIWKVEAYIRLGVRAPDKLVQELEKQIKYLKEKLSDR